MTPITIPRETFDQMREALEVLNHLDADINFLNTNELEEMMEKALSAAKAVSDEPTKLDDIEQYRMQMAGISTAALGYWKEGDDIHPDYDTVALRDVAKLYAKYDRLYKAVQPQAQREAERLYDAIENCLLNYRLHGFVQDDGDSYPLVDHLSHGDSIEDGRHEIRLICDSIYNTVLKPAHPQASEPQAQGDAIAHIRARTSQHKWNSYELCQADDPNGIAVYAHPQASEPTT